MMPNPEGKRTTDVNVIYESDLDRYLEHLGLIRAFHDGTLRCFHTKEVINLENLYGFFEHQGQILAISMNERAIETAFQLQRQEDAVRGRS